MSRLLSFIKLLVALFVLFHLNGVGASPNPVTDGILFNCGKTINQILYGQMIDFFDELQIDRNHYSPYSFNNGDQMGFVLTTPTQDQSTLRLSLRPEYDIKPDWIRLPIDTKDKPIVSKKEIVLSLLQHGRLTEFRNEGCGIQSFRDHIGIRQNIVAWVDKKKFIFPGRNSSAFNPVYWNDYSKWKTNSGKYGSIAVQAIHDIFTSRGYRMGCLTAAKVSMLHGITDYYTRIRPDEIRLKKAIDTLFAYGEPLQDPDPGYVWKEFRDTTQAELNRTEGKFLEAIVNVSKFNFVPGDWVYFKNTHLASSRIRGDEGSNAIYLGGNNFNNFYNLPFSPDLKGKPYPSTYTTEQKVSIIASWGGKVPVGKVVDENLFNKLMEAPSRDKDGYIIYDGGFLLKHRLTPKVF